MTLAWRELERKYWLKRLLSRQHYRLSICRYIDWESESKKSNLMVSRASLSLYCSSSTCGRQMNEHFWEGRCLTSGRMVFVLLLLCPVLLLGSDQSEKLPAEAHSTRSHPVATLPILNVTEIKVKPFFSEHGCHDFSFLEWPRPRPPSRQPPCAGIPTSPSPPPAQREKEAWRRRRRRRRRWECWRRGWCLVRERSQIQWEGRKGGMEILFLFWCC